MLGTVAGIWIAILLVILGGVLLVGVVVGKSSGDSVVKVEKNSILYFDLSGDILERYERPTLVQLIQEGKNDSPTLEDMIAALKLAKEDDRIEGLYLNCAGASMGVASREELSLAIEDFKSSGKWVLAYGDSYTQGDYLTASLADKIFLNPVGSIDIHGVGGMTPFFKDLLDKVGVKMQIIKVGTFKSAVEPYILNEMSEPARLQMTQYIDSIWSYIATSIAANRNIPVDSIRAFAPRMIMTEKGDFFVNNHLADSLLYRRQVNDLLLEYSSLEDEDEPRMITPSDYLSAKSVFSLPKETSHIAVLYAVGDISDSGEQGIVGDKMVDEITGLAEDDNVAGMVLRVNSPGGSAFASEQIWEALEYFKSKEKPLYVSMGDYAASGGYYISCNANCIFADKTTITGSIGVFGMIPDLSSLATDKLGVHFSTVESNPNGAGISQYAPMTPSQYAAMQRSVENIYDLFTSRVANGRGISQDSVKTIAEGRVWIATDALRLGLVDQIGTLQETVAAMAAELSLSSDDVVVYPVHEEKFWEKVLRESSSLEDIKAANYDVETLRYIEFVTNLTRSARVQARMPLVYIN